MSSTTPNAGPKCAHEMAAHIVTILPELLRDGRLNQMLTLEALLLDWERHIESKSALRAAEQLPGTVYVGVSP